MSVAIFKSPYDVEKTEQMVADVIQELKGTYKGNVGRWRRRTGCIELLPKKSRFFYGKIKEGTLVRVVFDSFASRGAWGDFIRTLNAKYGDNFGISAELSYKPVAVIAMRNEVKEVYVSNTNGGTSLAGFLLGGAAFGEAGAIVGGLSGKQRTMTTASTYNTGMVDVEILWSDGCIIKDKISEKSNLYNQILMMNLEQD